MEILKILGVNSTIWIQLGCFLVAYISLSQLIFKPYMAAHKERDSRTTGGEEEAGQILQQAAELQTQYETQARAINNQTKQIYDESRNKALEEYDRAIRAARAEASSSLEKSRSAISQGVSKLKGELAKEVPGVACAIGSKLLGKEIVQ